MKVFNWGDKESIEKFWNEFRKDTDTLSEIMDLMDFYCDDSEKYKELDNMRKEIINKYPRDFLEELIDEAI